MLKLREAMVKSGDTARKTGEQVVHFGEEIDHTMKAAAASMGLVLTAGAAVEKGIEMILRGVEDHVDKLEKRGEALRDKSTTLIGASFNAGMSDKAGDFKAAAERAVSSGFSGEEMSRVTAAVVNASGAKVGRGRIDAVLGGSLEAYKSAFRGGAKEEDASDVAVQYARLSQVGVEDQDLAYAAHMYHLDDSDMAILNRTKASGGDVRGALRVVLAAHTKNERMRALIGISDLATRRKVPMESLIANPSRLPLPMRSEARDLMDASRQSLPTLRDISGPEAEQRMYEKESQAMIDQNKEFDAEADRMANANRLRMKAARERDRDASLGNWFWEGTQTQTESATISRRWEEMRDRQEEERRHDEHMSKLDQLKGTITTSGVKNNTTDLNANGRDEGGR